MPLFSGLSRAGHHDNILKSNSTSSSVRSRIIHPLQYRCPSRELAQKVHRLVVCSQTYYLLAHYCHTCSNKPTSLFDDDEHIFAAKRSTSLWYTIQMPQHVSGSEPGCCQTTQSQTAIMFYSVRRREKTEIIKPNQLTSQQRLHQVVQNTSQTIVTSTHRWIVK